MSLTAHAGYGFKMKMRDIRNPEIFELLSKTDIENWLDGDGCDKDGNPTDEVFMYMRPWDYVELINNVAKVLGMEVVASLPGYYEADHEEICVVLKSTYLSAYGESEVLDLSLLKQEDKEAMESFSVRYFNATPTGWIFWPFEG